MSSLLNIYKIFTQNTEEIVETSLEWMIHHLGIAQVPLAHQIVGVSQVSKFIRQSSVLGQQTSRIARHECYSQTNIGSVSSCHQSCSGGSAGGVNIIIVKPIEQRCVHC